VFSFAERFLVALLFFLDLLLFFFLDGGDGAPQRLMGGLIHD
jgi:hypothetical protein